MVAASRVNADNAYEPIETASRDEITALQTRAPALVACGTPMSTLRIIVASSTRTACIPTICRRSMTCASFPSPPRRTCVKTTRSRCSPCRAMQVVRVHASSGTTGQPTVVGYTQNDIDMWATLMARSIHAAGGRRGDMVHVGYGYGLFTGGLGAHYGAERLGCTVIPMSGGSDRKAGAVDQRLPAGS
jgi:phenylacetate-CoA ligase